MTAVRRPALVFLALVTLFQAGNGLYRIWVMYQEGLRFGFRPWVWSRGLLEEVLLSVMLGVIAWWWLPEGRRRWAGWAIRFLAFAWILGLVQLVWVLCGKSFEHGVSWLVLAVLLLVGIWARRSKDPVTPAVAVEPTSWRHPAVLGALIFWLLQVPHLVFPYHWTDARTIWACRAITFEATGGLHGIFDCLDASRPPLYSILLWLGRTDVTFEGRLLPFLMVGACGIVVYHLLRRAAPGLASWGVLWFFMTVRVYQGAVSSYSDVPLMIAITAAVAIAADRDLLSGTWAAILSGLVAGAAASLIKRDGAVMLCVATGVLAWFSVRRLSPRLYAGLAGAGLGVLLWLVRPHQLYAPDQYTAEAAAAGKPKSTLASPLHGYVTSKEFHKHQAMGPRVLPTDTMTVTPKTFVTMAYGMQGQVLGHYGYNAFVWVWIIVAIWAWRARLRLPPEARMWGWIGVLGWLAIVGLYVLAVITGNPERATLFVIRTGFGRHLVHMFVFCLLHAAALASLLLHAPSPSPTATSA